MCRPRVQTAKKPAKGRIVETTAKAQPALAGAASSSSTDSDVPRGSAECTRTLEEHKVGADELSTNFR